MRALVELEKRQRMQGKKLVYYGMHWQKLKQHNRRQLLLGKMTCSNFGRRSSQRTPPGQVDKKPSVEEGQDGIEKGAVGAENVLVVAGIVVAGGSKIQ